MSRIGRIVLAGQVAAITLAVALISRDAREVTAVDWFWADGWSLSAAGAARWTVRTAAPVPTRE